MNVRILLLTAVLGVSSMAEDVSALLEPIREKHGLPGLAAAAVLDGKIVAIGATGTRRVGGKDRVTVEDKWHLGSCTKSMTASLAGVLVERGDVGWDQTVGGTLTKLNPKMAREWSGVTLEQLLGHRAGAPHEAPPSLWKDAWKRNGTPEDQRRMFVKGLLELAPSPAPGTKFVYSNQGYSIAAKMIADTADRPWEAMMEDMLFRPLGLKSAGFGSAGRDQPWGHRKDGEAVTPGPDADNPPAIWPGGGVHMSIGDFARYAAWHVEGARLLKPETFEKLHTPLAGQDYALGWNVTERGWANGTVWTHNGTNTMNYAVMWLAPKRKFAVVVATNRGGDAGEKGIDEAASALIGEVLK